MIVHTLKSAAAAICALVLLHGASALASTDQLRADAYFNAIAGGDADTITSFYDDKAEFHWVGGPLAGVYTGKAQIKAVWKRFVDAAGEIDYKVIEVGESRNGKITTVTARVDFIGPTQLPVKFVLMYENGKIVKEIWQVEKPTTYQALEPAPAQPAVEAPAAIAATVTEKPVAEAPAAIAATVTEKPVAEAPAATAATLTLIEPATPPLPEKVAAAPAPATAPAAENPEGVPPISLNTVSVDPVAPPPARKAAAPAPRKPKAKVAKKVRKKTFHEYDDDEDDGDDYAYEPGYRYGYGYGYRRYRSPLRFRFGYGYYND